MNVGVFSGCGVARITLPPPVTSSPGSSRLRVPPGTQSGQRFRLREHGDFVLEVHLKLPKLLDERSQELLREFGEINGESVREHPR